MTTIAAVTTASRTWIGGDSAVSIDSTVILQATPKVWLAGGVVWGCCGVTEWEQGLQAIAQTWKGGDAASFRGHVAADLAPELVRLVKRLGKKSVTECAAMFGARGALYYVEGDGLPWPVKGTYNAIGCGDLVALGVLHCTNRRGHSAERRIISALAAAAEHTEGTRAPFHTVSA